MHRIIYDFISQKTFYKYIRIIRARLTGLFKSNLAKHQTEKADVINRS